MGTCPEGRAGFWSSPRPGLSKYWPGRQGTAKWTERGPAGPEEKSSV